ncbi:MAG: hypothetical protein ACI8RD_001717, partial [Bacillariaceae sp.]
TYRGIKVSPESLNMLRATRRISSYRFLSGPCGTNNFWGFARN